MTDQTLSTQEQPMSIAERAADNIRALAISMVERAKSGHPGGAMGGADFIQVLFSEQLRYDPRNPEHPARDRFFMDPGHMSPMLYAQLALAGFFTMDELAAFRSWGSPTPGHPELCRSRMIENTSGPLGQGHTYAVGAAIAAKFLQHRLGDTLMPQRIYAFISDGGIQEEISQGAGRIAGDLGLDNLIMYYDCNDIQLSTRVEDITAEDVAAKYDAWGWNVFEVPGNDPAALSQVLRDAIETSEETGAPTLIIGYTNMAYKAVDEEGNPLANLIATHGQPISKAGASYAKTMEALGADPDAPFTIYEDVADFYAKRREELIAYWDGQYKLQEKYKKEHPDQAQLYDRWFAAEPTYDVAWQEIAQKANQATRAASATVLGELAKRVDNLIVASADLSNSDKTDGYLKGTKALEAGDFSGKFLQAGVSELTMAALCVGITLHGGMRAACGTFFVFSDYMKPVVRMAGLMEQPVIFIWSHDSFRVGEDGPTHEPVEQEAQIRLLEHLHNHSGRRALQVLRPADVHEATVAWQMAMENLHTPTALILSRQNIQDLPNPTYERACQLKHGAYVVADTTPAGETPDLTLIASGSEVSTLVQAAELLKGKEHKLRIVSVPSEGLFFDQPEAYRESVIPAKGARFGLTAGLPVTLLRLVGDMEHIHGLESFGFSAPYTVLDEKLGFTAEAVAQRIEELCR